MQRKDGMRKKFKKMGSIWIHGNNNMKPEFTDKEIIVIDTDALVNSGVFVIVKNSDEKIYFKEG